MNGLHGTIWELSIIHIVFDTKELTSTTSFLCCCSAFFPLIFFFAHFSCLRLFLCVRLVCFALPCTSSAEDNLELQSFYDVLIVVDRCSYTYTFIAYDCTTSNSFFSSSFSRRNVEYVCQLPANIRYNRIRIVLLWAILFRVAFDDICAIQCINHIRETIFIAPHLLSGQTVWMVSCAQ